MRSLIVTIPGTPVGKGRPRFTRAGRAYTPAKTAAYEQLVRICAAQALAKGHNPTESWPPLDGPLSVLVLAFLPVPASWPKWKRQAALAGEIHPTGRPDADNLAKAIIDGLQGVAFDDDAAVVSITVRKAFAERPYALAMVDQIQGHPATVCRAGIAAGGEA